MLDAPARKNRLGQECEAAATLPDLNDSDAWPLEPERDPEDKNDPENWPDAGDPSGPLNEASDRAAAVLRAAAAALDGRPASSGPVRESDPWDDYRDDGELVIESQPRTAIYLNQADQVVVRQEGPDGDFRQDPFVRFSQHYAPCVIRKIAELAGYQVTLAPRSVPVPASGPAAAASRSKRSAPGLFDHGDAP